MPAPTRQSSKRVDASGCAFAGSQLQLQLYVNRRQSEIDNKIIEALRLPAKSLTWVSPLEAENFREYKDAAFLEKIGLKHLRPQLQNFWPNSGPRWDGLARVPNSSIVILVEAKNYPGEVRGPGCTATDKTATSSRKRIVAALNTAAKNLGVKSADHWTGSLYQYANRLAHADFLRRKGVDARMVNVCFTGDRHPSRTTSVEQWQRSWIELKREIGFENNAPAWLADIALPAKDRSELAR